MSLTLLDLALVAVTAVAEQTACDATSESKACLRSVIEDDIAGWSAGEDTLFGRALKEIAKSPPAPLTSLAAVTFLERKPISESCRESLTQNRECTVSLMDAIAAWCRGDRSPIVDGVVKERARQAQAFRSQGGYQNSKWGMTPAEVRKIYPKAAMKGAEAVTVSDTLADKPALVGFGFARGRLVSVTAVFQQHYMNPNNYVQEFAELKTMLIKKYGEPVSDGVDWSRTRYQDDPERMGIAVAMGQAVISAVWVGQFTRIALVCDGEEAQARVTLTYSSRELEHFADTAAEAKAAAKL